MDLKLFILDEFIEGIQLLIIDYIGDMLKKFKKEGIFDDEVVVENVIRVIKQEGCFVILFVEQYVDFCCEVLDCFYVMDCGVVVVFGEIVMFIDEVVKKYLQV